jgi:hypothetical protein
MMPRTKEDIKKYQQEYRRTHKEQRQVYDQLRYVENKEFFEVKNSNYYLENKENIINKSKQFNVNNKDLVRNTHREYIKNKRSNNINFKLKSNVSANIRFYLKSNNSSKNNKSTLKYLPYPIQELQEHLEKQFEPWMSWDNYGRYDIKTWDDGDLSTWTWQIDHIIPHSKFQYLSMADEGFKKCWALNNLRPLSAKQNLIDGNRR